jgi:hypothetical protein
MQAVDLPSIATALHDAGIIVLYGVIAVLDRYEMLQQDMLELATDHQYTW